MINHESEVRLFDAFRLLVAGHSVKEAAHNTGFKDLSHFYHRFKTNFGAPPSQFLKIHRQRAKQKRRDESVLADEIPKDWIQSDLPFYDKALAIPGRLPKWKGNLPNCRPQTIDAD